MSARIHMTAAEAKALLGKQPPKQGSHRFSRLNVGLRRTRGEMNATETKYANELEARKQAGEIADWWFEPMSLRLSSPPEGQPCRVTVDFMVLMAATGIVFMDDVKGTGVDNDASFVRMRFAAEQFPLWRFRIVKERTKKQGGGWEVREL